MREARPQDRQKIIDLLTAAFIRNRSINWITRKEAPKEKWIKGLMEYALDESRKGRGAFISENEKGVLLFTRPYLKSGGMIANLLSSIKLVQSAVGVQNIPKVLRRERYVKSIHPDQDFLYLWFIAIDPEYQGKGMGSSLLSDFLALSDNEQLPVCLETSTPENLPFYRKWGFEIYHEWKDPKAGFPLWFLKREAQVPLPNVSK